MSKNTISAPRNKFHVKKNDVVVVISGTQRGQRGKVLEVLRGKNRVLVENVNVIKKTQRKSQDNPQGGIIEREGSLPISNVMLAERYDARKNKGGAQAAKK